MIYDIKINNMSLEYFLFCKKRYDNIVSNLENIIDDYREINCAYIPKKDVEFDNKLLLVHQMCQKNKHIEDFLKTRNEIVKIKTFCEEKIYDLCPHEFVDDYIDTSCESSQKITYCKICEFTK